VSDARRCGQRSAMMPYRPDGCSCTGSSLRRAAGQSCSAWRRSPARTRSDTSTRRSSAPIRVPGPTLVSSSFCSNGEHGCGPSGQSRTVTVPGAFPSTRTRWPVLILAVPNAVPVTAGRPYSRHTIAAWLIMPPTSVTVATRSCRRSGPSLGAVSGAISTPVPASNHRRFGSAE